MKKQEFYKKLEHLLRQILGKDYIVTFCNIQKMNFVDQDAFIIRKQNQSIAPTIYLKEHYAKFLNGADIETIAKDMIANYRIASMQQKEFVGHLDFLNQKVETERKLFFRCVNTEKNKERLTNIPHRECLNLSLVSCILVKAEPAFLTSITVTKELMNYYGWTEERLFQLSMENSCRLFPEQVLSMSETIFRMMSDQENTICDSITINEIKKTENAGIELMVISNTSYISGFISIFYPELLARLAEEKDANLIIIPSSIHEALVLPDYGQIKKEEINEMIIEVNRTQVIEEEQLSDEAYYYDKDSKALFLMKDYKEGNRTLFVKI